LLAMTMTISVFIYGWLRVYSSSVTEGVDECPEGVNLVIKAYECYSTNATLDGSLKVVLKNRGTFTVDGYTLRVHDKPGADFGYYILDGDGTMIAPGEEYNETYYFEDYDFDGYVLTNVSVFDVHPFIEDKIRINCEAFASQKALC